MLDFPYPQVAKRVCGSFAAKRGGRGIAFCNKGKGRTHQTSSWAKGGLNVKQKFEPMGKKCVSGKNIIWGTFKIAESSRQAGLWHFAPSCAQGAGSEARGIAGQKRATGPEQPEHVVCSELSARCLVGFKLWWSFGFC